MFWSASSSLCRVESEMPVLRENCWKVRSPRRFLRNWASCFASLCFAMAGFCNQPNPAYGIFCFTGHLERRKTVSRNPPELTVVTKLKHNVRHHQYQTSIWQYWSPHFFRSRIWSNCKNANCSRHNVGNAFSRIYREHWRKNSFGGFCNPEDPTNFKILSRDEATPLVGTEELKKMYQTTISPNK